MQPIYLDYAAATPLHPTALAAMQPYLTEQFYNPSSPYMAAKKVRTAVEEARRQVAHWLGARPSEVIFTAGATESINIALHGVMRHFSDAHVVTSTIEHPAVLQTVQQYNHTLLQVLSNGSVNLSALAAAITDKTVLISIGYANNEIGTIQSLPEITQLVASVRQNRQGRGNTLPLYVHTDASQAGNYLDLHTARLGVDLLTLNGAKIYGPKQTGIVYVKAGTKLAPFITGGGQELGVRSGTENVAGIIGFSVALDLAQTNRKTAIAGHAALRDQLQTRLQTVFPQATINGNLKKRLPNNLHISWPGIDGERLVLLLDERGVQAATGSACAANKQTASHVLQAIGLDDELVHGSLRLTIGTPTTQQAIERAAHSIIECVQSMTNTA